MKRLLSIFVLGLLSIGVFGTPNELREDYYNIFDGIEDYGIFNGVQGGGAVIINPPSFYDVIAWYNDNDGEFLLDKKDPKLIDPSPIIGRINCLSVTASTEITLPHLSGTESISSYEGTESPSVASGKLTFSGTGYCANIVIDDGTILPLSEDYGVSVYDVSGKGNTGTVANGARDQQDSLTCHNLRYGFFKTTTYLFDDPNDFETNWGDVAASGTVSTTNNLATAPDGTITAAKSVYNVARFGRTTRGIGTVAAKDVTCYFKAGTAGTAAYIRLFDGGEIAKAVFDINLGSVTSATEGASAFIEDVGNGWFKCWLSLDNIRDFTAGSVYVGAGAYDGATLTGSIYYWGANVYEDYFTYYPGLPFNSISIGTADGVADKLTVVGLTGGNAVTNGGTATPTAGAGEITFTAGTFKNITIDGTLVYDCTDLLGRSTTTIASLSGSWPDAGVATGAGGLDTVWAVRPADASGVVVAANYQLLTNPPDTVSNNSEVDFRLENVEDAIDSILVTIGGTPERRLYDGMVNSKPSYTLETYTTSWDGSNWITATASGSSTNATATGYLPPLTSWPNVGSDTVTVDYGSLFADTSDDDDCTFARFDHEDLLNYPNLTRDIFIQWEELGAGGGTCTATELLCWKQGTVNDFSTSQYAQIIRYLDSLTCGVGPLEIEYDADGTPEYNADGTLEFVQPE